VEGGGGLDHLGGRAMQLYEVERVDAEIAAAAVGPGAERLGRIVLGPLLGAPAHLGGDHDAVVGMGGEEPPDQRLAAAVAVDVGGVEEGDAAGEGCLEHRHRVDFADFAPVGAELPGAQADRRDGAAAAAEGALLHASTLPARPPTANAPPLP